MTAGLFAGLFADVMLLVKIAEKYSDLQEIKLFAEPFAETFAEPWEPPEMEFAATILLMLPPGTETKEMPELREALCLVAYRHDARSYPERFTGMLENSSWQADLDALRASFRETASYPVIGNAERLPDRDNCRAQKSYAIKCASDCRVLAEWDLSRTTLLYRESYAWDSVAEWWGLADEATSPYTTRHRKRWALAKLRDGIGEVDFFLGNWPVWRP